METLNPKYKKVIDKWFALGCKDGDNITAWIEFSKTNDRECARISWSRMLTNVTVKDYILEKQKEVQERLMIEHNVGVGDIIKKLKKIGLDGQTEWQGVDIAVETPHQLKAIEMLTKIIGANAPKDEDKDEKKVNIEVNVYQDTYKSARDHIRDKEIEDEGEGADNNQ